jgi:hypothetical protein
MSAHATKRLLLVGVTAEIVYRTMVRQRVRAYLGIAQGHKHFPEAADPPPRQPAA